MGARTRRFTSLATGSSKAPAVFVGAVMFLAAGCGGSGGSAADAGTPVIRGDVAASETSDPGNSGVSSLFDSEAIDRIHNLFPVSVERTVESDPDIIFVGKGAVQFIFGDGKSSETVVKPPADAPVVIPKWEMTDVVLTPDVTEKPRADNFAVVTNRRLEVYMDNVGKYRYWGPFGPGNDSLVTVSEAYDTLAAAQNACVLAAQLDVDCLTVVLADN